MSRQISYVLIADGGTDRALVPLIDWSIHQLDPEVEILEPEFRKRSGSVSEYLTTLSTAAMLVFVHRDAESESLEVRLQEFDGVVRTDIVPVVPVRMTEAWLLTDGAAISRAADRPGNLVDLPAVGVLETLNDPKHTLESLLLTAAGEPTGRRRKKFQRSLVDRRVNVASLTVDFSPLCTVESFQRFQAALLQAYPYGPSRV